MQPELGHVTIAGDFRRGCELVADLALVAEAPGRGEDLTMLDSSDLKVYVADRKHFGAALLHATGSAEHLEQLRGLAERNGMRLDLKGLHRGGSVVAAKEADIYRALGPPFIEPELRRTRRDRA
jgi:DNA polymerase (family X)